MSNHPRKRKIKSLDESDSEAEFSDNGNRNKPIISQKTVEQPPKHSNVYLRTISTIVIIVMIAVIISMGHFYCLLFILCIQAGVFREIIHLKRDYMREEPIKFSTKFNWYFFYIAIAFTLLKNFNNMLKDIPNVFLQTVLEYKKFIFFCLYMAGFLIFVLHLKKGFYRYQIRLFFWTHLVLGLILAVSSTVNLIYHGLIWFLASILLVTANDIFAYIFGKLFGKRPLISLSPNKTVEGFVGGMGATIFFAWFVR